MPTGARGVEKGESDMHLYGTKRDRSERVVCCFPLYKLIFSFCETLRRESRRLSFERLVKAGPIRFIVL